MPIPKDVLKYLDKKGVKYEVVPHRKVFTAYDLAQTLGEELEKVAKTLLLAVELPEVKSRGKYYVVAVPASYKVALDKVRKALKARWVAIAPEKAMARLGIEPGALSPFAALHQLELLLDKALLRSKDILVRAGSLTESVRMRSRDLHKIEKALAGMFGVKTGVKLQKRAKAKAKAKAKVPAARKPQRQQKRKVSRAKKI
ncbi:MAG: YbaK/EbsC family protein [Acidobacteriota bacterium]